MIDKLYGKYYEHLLWYCINLSGNNRALSEDIVQDTFMRALTNAHVLNELNELQCRSWLYKTAKNIFIDKFRRISKEPQSQVQMMKEDDLSEIIVRQLCNQLPGEERTLFLMRYLDGYNSSELGEMFDLPSSTVRARLSSARKKMAEIYFEKIGKGE